MNTHLRAFNTVLLYVKNLSQSADFYRQLGFEIQEASPSTKQAVLGTMAITLLDQAQAEFQQDTLREPKGSGVFLMCRVEGIDEYHQQLIQAGLQPSSQPRDWPWGNREFAIKDPDGYKVVFWEKR